MLKSVKTAFAMNSTIAVVKLLVSIVSGSAAMKAEFWHSLADCGNQVLLLVGMKRSQIPEDHGHSFGHGKEEYFWSFMVAIILFLLGSVLSIKEGLQHISHPEPVSNFSMVVGVLIFGCLAEGYSWKVAMYEFGQTSDKGKSLLANLTKSKNSSLIVIIVEDTAAMIGLVTALIGAVLTAFTGNPIFDAVASILIGCLLAVMVFFLATEMKNLLIGESVDKEVLQKVRERLSSVFGSRITSIGEIKSMQLGSHECIIDIDCDFDDNMTGHDLEELTPVMEREIRAVCPGARYISIQPVKVK